MSEPEDLYAAARAGLDQVSAILNEYVPVLGSFYRALQEEGIPPAAIGPMLVELQRRLMTIGIE